MAKPTSDERPSDQGGSKGDNRSNTDRDGNRGPVKSQPGGIPDPNRAGIPSVGQGDTNKRTRDRGDGRKRVSNTR